MSYSQQRPVKMHCKVCESAKMSPAIIASHFPKNKGVTVCPTLLAIQCRGCGKRGHTISYCKEKPKPTTATTTTLATLAPKPRDTTPKMTAYDSLYMSDDDDDATVVIQIQEPKKEKKEKKEKKAKTVGPAKKFCWATAESESSGSDEEEEEE